MVYRAVLFDLFDTLVSFDRNRLPELRLDGRVVRSTAGLLHPILASVAPQVTLPALYEALTESWREAERLRAIDHREVAAPDRFARMLRHLAVDPEACSPALVQRLVETHRRELSRAASFPAHHRQLLESLAGRYRLAVVSNFDYTPTAMGILEREGVAGLFDTIVVSDTFGWRKPARSIFDEALRRLDTQAGAALFVGDRPDIDVAGAQGAGMHAVWLNPAAEPLPPGLAQPEYEIRDLGEVAGILER